MSTTTPATTPKPQPPAKTGLASVKSQIESDAFRQQIARVLPKHLTADRMIRVAITAAMRTPGMRARTMASMLLPRPEMRMTMDFMEKPLD